uniref:Uncharacterized protein n=1 Tax=Anopheles maculatus TaxID=74869 RepID=A0A182TB38_9DIPT
MDPAVAWYQEEQDGPSKLVWMRIWDTNSDLYGSLHANYGPGSNNGQETLKGPAVSRGVTGGTLGALGDQKQHELPFNNSNSGNNNNNNGVGNYQQQPSPAI